MFTTTTRRFARTAFRAANSTPDLPLLTAGLLAGSLVETATGWRPVERIRPGDRVQTLDGGLAEVCAAHRRALTGRDDRALNLVHVPGGAMDTCSDLVLPAEQRVLLDLPRAEARHGTPLVLVPAAALVGWQGIALHNVQRARTAVVLEFAAEEIVFANTGAMIHCPPAGQAVQPGADAFFPVLGYRDSRALLGLGEDAKSAPARAMPRKIRAA